VGSQFIGQATAQTTYYIHTLVHTTEVTVQTFADGIHLTGTHNTNFVIMVSHFTLRIAAAAAATSALIHGVGAQSTTSGSSSTAVVSLYLDPIEGVGLFGSVVTVKPEATSYSVQCHTTATTPIPPNICSNVRGVTVLQGPATLSAVYTIVDKASTTVLVELRPSPLPSTMLHVVPVANKIKIISINHFDCTLSDQIGVCTNQFTENTVSTTFLSTYTRISDRLTPVTITAGAKLLPSSTSSPAASPTPSSTRQTAQQTPTSSSSVAAGVPRATQGIMAAGLVGLAGVAVAGMMA